MEEKIKEEINQNIEKYKEYGYLMEYTNNKDKVVCTRNTCLVNWYRNREDGSYDDESLTGFSLDSCEKMFTSSIKHEISSKNNVNPKFKNLLENLSLIQFERNENVALKRENKGEISFFEYSKLYLKFIKCINLNEGKKSVLIFDMDIFYQVFHYPYVDENIITFIKKLRDDTMLYEAKDKQSFVVILIYAYHFVIRHKLDICIKDKIRKNIIYVKTEYDYKISYMNDYNIDKYILKIRKITSCYEESLFLNYFYVTYISKPTIEKYIFIDFQQRINKAIKNVESTKMVSFLKNVYFYQTVLYNYLDETQVMKSIVDFYSKKIKSFNTETITKHIYEFLYSLSLNCESLELYNLINRESISLFSSGSLLENDGTSAYREAFLLINSRSLKDFCNFIEDNRESYYSVKRLTDILFSLTKSIQGYAIGLDRTLEIMKLYLCLHEEIKLDFFIRILKQYVKDMVLYLDVVNGYCKDNNNVEGTDTYNDIRSNLNLVLCFNKSHWNIFSKLVLSLQRYLTVLKEGKKKKKNVENVNLEKLFLRFTENIYKLEHKLIKSFGKESVVEIKLRSFKIEDIK